MAGKVLKVWHALREGAAAEPDTARLLVLIPKTEQRSVQQENPRPHPPNERPEPMFSLVPRLHTQVVVCPHCTARIEPGEQKRIDHAQMECPWCDGRFAPKS